MPRASLPWILLIAVAMRVYAVLAWPSLLHPDENFQSLEQAHRLAFGYGVTPWEFHDGVRSLLIPWLLSRLFALLALFSAAPASYLLAAHLLLAALSLLTVVAAYGAGQQHSARHALIAGLVAATWFQIVNFADRSLSEAIAANFLIAAVALAGVPPARYSWRRLLWLGACLAMCVAIRTDLAPGALVVACWAGGLRVRQHWLPMLLGAVPVLLIFGICDWLTWGRPFHSYYALFDADLLHGVLAGQGTQPFSWLYIDLAARWGGAGLLLLGLLLLSLRRYPLWVLTAAAVFLIHSFIGHKEYRYVYPAVACLLIAAAMASVDLMEAMRQAWAGGRERTWTAALASGWLALSALLAIQPANAGDWTARADHIRLSFWLYGQPQLCGLMLYDYAWFNTGGYAYLHRRVPMYEWPDHSPAGQRRALDDGAANYILLKRASFGNFVPRYVLRQCDQDRGDETMCVAQRPGGCANRAGLPAVQ
jgi:hypothetical protein